ncbi:MAG: hypothetical protein ACR2LT_07375 [Pyrinomonadaceae bacterium]
MIKNSSDDSLEQHISDGGYRSIYHKQTGNAPLDFSGAVEITRDPEDALTIFSLLRAVWVLLIILTISTGINVFLSVRKADRIVVDKSSGRVIELNNRDYGATETVSISPDRPADTDKKYLVKEYLKSLYEVQQSTRETEINKLLRMMDADLSLSFAGRLKQNGLLAQEKAESVNSAWELQDLTVDERDPYILRAIGIRRIRRKSAGQDVEETVQLKCKFLLKDSSTSPARNDNNLRTGFTILRFRVEPMSSKSTSPIALLADDNGEPASSLEATDSKPNADPDENTAPKP